MPIVLHLHAAVCSPEPPAVSPHGLRRLVTTAAAQALPTTAALTGSRSGRTATRSPTTIAPLLRSRALTIRLPRARTRHHNLIPRQAVAIQFLHAPIPHQAPAIQLPHAPTPRRARAIAVVAAIAAEAAEAIAVVVIAAVVVAAAETLTAEVAPPLARVTNLFANSRARPDLPGGPFLFESEALSFFLPRQLTL